ncbi:MAG: aldose epimerase family protein [Pseudomonadota bacterium]
MQQIFGQTARGQEVHRITLDAHGFRAHVLTLGGILQSMTAWARELTLGAEDLGAYDRDASSGGPMQYHGAIIGPVAGRVRDATGLLDGAEIRLEASAGADALHCGSAGLHTKVWAIEGVSSGAVTLSTTSAPGEGGLPGTRRFRARYALVPEGLHLTLDAESDAPTWVNLTQHSYWQLHDAPTIDGQALEIAASRYLPIDDRTLPSGEIAEVAGSRFDFRQARPLRAEDRLDHCFCLDTPGLGVPATRLLGADGVTLEVRTDAPGMQVFTMDFEREPRRRGIAFEAQDWPDAPNHAAFPSIRLDAGAPWRREVLFAVHRTERKNASV